MKDESPKDSLNPSLHIVPLDRKGHLPLIWLDKDGGDENIGTFVAITTDGRISGFPAKYEMVSIGDQHRGYISSLELTIKNRMDDRFPKGKITGGGKITQYLLTCVMYGDEKEEKLIFEVVGFQDQSKELEKIYDMLHSLRGTTIGDTDWRNVETYISSEPVRSWINRLIDSLKEQGWAEYVRTQLER